MKKSDSSEKSTLLRPISVAYIVALTAITLVSLRFIIGSNVAQKWIFAIFFLPIIPSFYFVMSGRARSRLLGFSINALTITIFLIIGFLLLGIIQDVSGETCVGFFGVRQSCLQHNMLLSLLAFEIWPPLMLLGLGIFVTLIVGLIDEIRRFIKSRR